MIEVYNTTRGCMLATTANQADTFGTRLKGLLGRDGLADGEALIIDPCTSIHTFFMRFPIDALFVDEQGRVVRALPAMKPWRLSGIYLRARKVIELPAGVIEATQTREGDQLSLRETR